MLWIQKYHRLSETDNRELSGLLNPSKSVPPESLIGDNGALQIQADKFQEAINETQRERDNTHDEDVLFELEERIVGLEEARDRTLEQRELEEVRALQK